MSCAGTCKIPAKTKVFERPRYNDHLGMATSEQQGNLPRGSIYNTIIELGAQNHNGDGLLGPNSIIVVYMDPLGWCALSPVFRALRVAVWGGVKSCVLEKR